MKQITLTKTQHNGPTFSVKLGKKELIQGA